MRLTLLLSLFLIVSCNKESYDLSISKKEESIFIYMIADNDLDYFAVSNINQMEEAFYKHLPLGNLFVYIDRSRYTQKEVPVLYKITADNTPNISSKIIKEYPEQNSSDPKNFEKVLKDVEEKVVLKGIVLWSHGSAWLPDMKKLSSKRKTKSNFYASFGKDMDIQDSHYPTDMNIIDLANVLQNKHYEFLLLDACFMASIEVLYELRNSFSYIIASPTEILVSEFPYKEILPILFKNTVNYKEITKIFINYYKKNINPSASISIINTKKIEEFSLSYHNLISENNNFKVNIENIFQYETEKNYWLFDLKQIILQYPKTSSREKALKDFEEFLVDYQYTDFFFNKIKLSNSFGISIYIPNNFSHREKENLFYETLSWSKQLKP